MQNFFKIYLKFLNFLFALSFPAFLPGVWLLVTFLILKFCLPNFAKRDKGLQIHTFFIKSTDNNQNQKLLNILIQTTITKKLSLYTLYYLKLLSSTRHHLKK